MTFPSAVELNLREALGADSDCEGIDLSDMYDDYIYGLKELADINREFSQSLSLGESVSYVAERSEKHAGAVVAGELTFVDVQNRA